VHQRVAAEARADDHDVDAREHVDDVLEDLLVRFVGVHLVRLPHVGVHHEVGRVGFDDLVRRGGGRGSAVGSLTGMGGGRVRDVLGLPPVRRLRGSIGWPGVSGAGADICTV